MTAAIERLKAKHPIAIPTVQAMSAIFVMINVKNGEKAEIYRNWLSGSKTPIKMTRELRSSHWKRMKQSSYVLVSRHIITEEIYLAWWQQLSLEDTFKEAVVLFLTGLKSIRAQIALQRSVCSSIMRTSKRSISHTQSNLQTIALSL